MKEEKPQGILWKILVYKCQICDKTDVFVVYSKLEISVYIAGRLDFIL